MSRSSSLEYRISATQSTPPNITYLICFLRFSVMGDFVFGRGFAMFENDDWHVAVIMLRRKLALFGPLSFVPWLAQIGFAFLPRFWRINE